MAELIARTPAHAVLAQPIEIGRTSIEEMTLGPVTWIAPYNGQEKAVAAALKSSAGVAFPKPGQVTRKGGVRALSIGPGQALLIGASLSLDDAATTDQSAAWCAISLAGEDARDVLARLTPLDLRPSAFAIHRTARTMVGHMTASLTRTDENAYEIMVFRSMAHTLVHDLTRAMRHVSGRAAL